MKDLSWQTISSEYLYRYDWFTARKDRCMTKEGKIIDPYFVLEYPDWVNAMALTEDNKVIIVRQYRHAYGETILEIPGGVLDSTDASPEIGMRRELLEETGYSFSNVEYLGKISPNPSTNTNITHMFLATGGVKTGEQQLDHNEEIEVYLYTIDELKQLLKENQIMQSLHATCLFYGLARLGEMKY